jgi:hypothetical protein
MSNLATLFEHHLGIPTNSGPDPEQNRKFLIVLSLWVLFLAYLVFFSPLSHAGVATLPGEDASDKLEAAGTLLRMIDTGLFKWGARLFSGMCIMSAGWALKEQRFGIATICVIGAVIFGTAPVWVKNIFEIGGNQGLFSVVPYIGPQLGALAYA